MNLKAIKYRFIRFLDPGRIAINALYIEWIFCPCAYWHTRKRFEIYDFRNDIKQIFLHLKDWFN